jgi:PAS domain S-box-containing protein
VNSRPKNGARPEAGLRRRAELLLKGSSAKPRALRREADAQHLVHELQVHQIELELQNSELKKARDQSELLLQKYTDLYEYAPAGYFSLAADGTIRLVNLAGALLVGLERSRLLGQSLLRHVAPECQPVLQTFLHRVFAGANKQTCAVTLRSTGPAREVSIEAELSVDRQDCLAVVEDITLQRQAEEVLRRNEALFAALIERAPVGIYIVDDQLRLLQVNPRAQPVFSKIHPLIGRNIREIIPLLWPRKTAEHILERFRHTLRTAEPYHSTDFSERRRDTGEKEFYEWQLQRITLPAGQQRVVCFFNNITERTRAAAVQRRLDLLAVTYEAANRDIVRRRTVEATLRKSERTQSRLLTESRRLHTQLRHLTRQILTAQEDERKHISRELHDDVMQRLVGINVELSALSRRPAAGARTLKSRLVRTQRLVQQSVAAVHRFARELRPAVLDDLGLIPALRAHCHGLVVRKKFKIRLNIFRGVETLAGDRRTVLFRVAQEALNNVARHAKASRVSLRISKTAHGVRMDIKDDGRSFNVAKALLAKTNARLGLVGMRERIEMVGGSLAISSAPGRGSTVRAEIPFHPEKSPS